MRFITFSLLILLASPVFAQGVLPVPPAIKDVPALKIFTEQSDAKIEFVGRQHGIDMWVAQKEGAIQVLYTTPNGQAMLMNGFLFGPDGTLVTEKGLRDYAEGNPSFIKELAERVEVKNPPQSPGEKLWFDLSNAAFVEFGSKDAPIVYVFVDPNCPHCKKYWQAAIPYVSEGNMRVRFVPVGILGDESLRDAVDIIASQDRQKAWLDTVEGKLENSLKSDEIALNKVKSNFELMQRWKIESTPFSVYKDVQGKTKMFRGNPDDMVAFLELMGVDSVTK